MQRHVLLVLIVGLLSGCGWEISTHAEVSDQQKARTMLARVVAEVQVNQAEALRKFTAGTDGFKDGNIYPFCFDLKSGIVLSGQTAGRDIRTFANGGGQLMFDAAQNEYGVVSEAKYLARKPPPADDTAVNKITVVTRVGTK